MMILFDIFKLGFLIVSLSTLFKGQYSLAIYNLLFAIFWEIVIMENNQRHNND